VFFERFEAFALDLVNEIVVKPVHRIVVWGWLMPMMTLQTSFANVEVRQWVRYVKRLGKSLNLLAGPIVGVEFVHPFPRRLIRPQIAAGDTVQWVPTFHLKGLPAHWSLLILLGFDGFTGLRQPEHVLPEGLVAHDDLPSGTSLLVRKTQADAI